VQKTEFCPRCGPGTFGQGAGPKYRFSLGACGEVMCAPGPKSALRRTAGAGAEIAIWEDPRGRGVDVHSSLRSPPDRTPRRRRRRGRDADKGRDAGPPLPKTEQGFWGGGGHFGPCFRSSPLLCPRGFYSPCLDGAAGGRNYSLTFMLECDRYETIHT
jgi:ribosomal protein S27AE